MILVLEVEWFQGYSKVDDCDYDCRAGEEGYRFRKSRHGNSAVCV